MSHRLHALTRWSTAALIVLAVGCANFDKPYSSGQPASTNNESAHGGNIAGNWDPDAARITLTPAQDVNPIRSQHVLVATVVGKQGGSLGGRRVEWMIPQESVGAIVAVDENGVYAEDGSKDTSGLHRSDIGDKVDNAYAVTHTASKQRVLNMGTKDKADDIVIQPGQTWISITSATEGTTDVIAYAPGIQSWDHHKAFATKHWMDVNWQFPADATNRVGSDHVLVTQVMRHSDKSPLVGYFVTYQIVSGPAATLQPGGQQSVTVESDAGGLASVTLRQASPAAGENVVAISIVRPGNEACCTPDKPIAMGKMTKTWLAPTIGIEKSAPGRAAMGENFRYDITVSNDSDVSTRETVVTDVLPDGIQYVSSSPTAQVSGQTLSWNLGTVASGGSRDIAVTVRATKTGRFTNCAVVTAEAGLQARDCADTVVVAPALQLTKSAPAEMLLCDPITYRYVVRNNGTGAATNVRITDNLPAGLTAEGGGRSVNIDVGDLEPGASQTFEIQATAARPGDYTNTATATASGGLTAEDSAQTVVRQPVLAITKTGPDTAFIGRPVTFEVTVTNTGDAPSRNTVLTDTLPAGGSFVSASAGGTQDQGTVTWSIGTLAPQASRTVRVTVTAAAAATLTNRAVVEGDCAAEVRATHSTRVVGIPALLLEVVDIDDPIEVGSNETYEITVTNQGSAPDTQIEITATLPAEMSFMSASGPSQFALSGKTVTFSPVASLAPGARITFRVVARADAPGDVRFAVAMESAELTSPVNETEATRLY